MIIMGFNSRTPCGVRPLGTVERIQDELEFQFTHPVWGATDRPSVC